MSVVNKNEKEKVTVEEGVGTLINKKVGNYEKHPFFVKKAKEAKELLAKVGLPEQLTEKVN